MVLTATLSLALLTLAPSQSPVTPRAVEALAPSHAEGRIAQDAKDSGGASGKKKKIIRLDAITVEGRIQKPQAFYILQRSTLNFEELNKTESFIPKVEKSVENDPF